MNQLKSTYSGKRVFITGHTGFKGSWLIKILSDLGADLKGYSLAPENKINLYTEMNADTLCESVISDLRDRIALRKAVLDFQPDFIFHLAAQPLVRLSYEIPSETFEVNRLWLRGGFPLSYLSKDEELSVMWRQNYIKTFLERDIPNLGFSIPAAQLRKFWIMICHYHGGIFNASELGKSLGISYHTAKHYLEILEGTFMIRVLQPWYENLKKRQVKTPKIYFRDSGIYHTLLGLNNNELLSHSPKLGASWEGFALEQIIRFYKVEPEECYFWASHSTAEIDLLIFKNGRRIGFEFKYTDTPKITPSMKLSLEYLKLDQIKVIFPGNIKFKLSEQIEAVGLESLVNS
jgi:predicted AAA+ superfamily ATPase